MIGSAWRDFADAALRPSPTGAFGALGVAAVVLSAAAFAGAPRLLEHVDPGYLMVDWKDRDVVLMQRTLALCHSPPRACVIAMLGDSALQSGIASVAAMQDAITSRLPAGVNASDVDLHLLMTFGMTLRQKCAVTDRVADHVTGALVVAVEPEIAVWGLELERARHGIVRDALDSAALEEEYRLAGLPASRCTGVYALDHFDFLAPRVSVLLTRMLGSPLQVVDLPSSERRLEGAAMEADLQQYSQRINRRLGARPDQCEGLAVLGRLIDRFRERSTAPVVLVESPRHPKLRAALRIGEEPAYELYQERMRRLADAHGARYWCLDADAQIGEPDFADALHIVGEAGRDRFTRQLGSKLAELIGSEEAH